MAQQNWWGADGVPAVFDGQTGASIDTSSALSFDPTIPINGQYAISECEPQPPETPPTPTPTPTATFTLTNTPTLTPTPSFTSLQLNGEDSSLKGVIFWAAFNETSSDVDDSGSQVDNFDLGSSRFSTFLFQVPYCSLGANPPSDNGAESPYSNWYIRHCPKDHRFMFARTVMNAFLNYERRELSLLDFLNVNYGDSLGNPSNALWNDTRCYLPDSSNPSFTYSYAQARSLGLYAEWLDNYMTCKAALNDDFTNQRAYRAYNYTIFPQINEAVADFENLPATDLTNGAFSTLGLNFSGLTQITCVGQCWIIPSGGTEAQLVDHYTPADEFLMFARPLSGENEITQQDVIDAYNLHIQRVSTCSPNYDSVGQPVLRWAVDNNNQHAGYLWITNIYQRSADMSHFPR